MARNDLLVEFRDLMHANCIHVYTRLPLGKENAVRFGAVWGVVRTILDGDSQVLIGQSCDNRQTRYLHTIRTACLFDFEELAPQILWVIADILKVEVEDLTVRVTTPTDLRDVDARGLKIVDAARTLRPRQAPSNPYAPNFAATLDDLVSGVELLAIIGIAHPTSDVRLFSRETTSCVSQPHNYGIAPPFERGAHGKNFAVVNTKENRTLLYLYLLDKGHQRAAQELLALYPELG